jgi:hypothetical protein
MLSCEVANAIDTEPVTTLNRVSRHSSCAVLLGVFLLVSGVLAFAGAAAAEDAPLVLTDKHVGMTAGDIVAEEAAEEAERVELARAAETEPVNEWNDASLDGEEAVEDEAVEEEALVEEPSSTTDAALAAPMGFGGCVEASIRGGNSFDESSRVCRAVFPEPTTE